MPTAVAVAAAYDSRVAVYTRRGVADAEARDWADTAIDPRQGVEWADAGYTTGQAEPWLDAGWQPEDAALWLTEYDPETARRWADAGIPDGAEAVGWEDRGFTPIEAARWIAAGCDCATTAGTYADQMTGKHRQHALNSYLAGYTAAEAAALNWEDPNVVAGVATIAALRANVTPSSPAA